MSEREPGVVVSGSTLTAMAPAEGELTIAFYDSGHHVIGSETVPAGETRAIEARGAYWTPSLDIRVTTSASPWRLG